MCQFTMYVKERDRTGELNGLRISLVPRRNSLGRASDSKLFLLLHFIQTLSRL